MILPFTAAEASDVRIAGGKGASLARLRMRGHAVPTGFVVPTHVFAAVAEATGVRTELAPFLDVTVPLDEVALAATVERLRARLLVAPLPDALVSATRNAIEAIEREVAGRGDDAAHTPRWAVRSSAVAEDTATASFAGQYETVLGVRGADAVLDALRVCFASFVDAHAIAYRRRVGRDDLDAAVVIQRIVPATAAGVCFSIDPVTSDPTTLVLDANVGLGESVVSGRVTPDTLRIARDDLTLRSVRIGDKQVRTVLVDGGVASVPNEDEVRRSRCLDDSQARAIAQLALAVEREEGHPVDIEWALEGDTLHLLQARPITTTSAASSLVPPPGFRAELDTAIDPAFPLYSNGNISEVLPGCVPPLAFSLVAPVIDHSFRSQLAETGAMVDDHPGLRMIGFFFHRPYLCVSYLAEAARRSPGISPDRVYEEFVGKVETPSPAFSREDFTFTGIGRLLRAIRAMLRRRRTLESEAAHAIERTRAEVHALTADVLASRSDASLADELRFDPARANVSVLHVWASTFAVAAFGLLRNLTARWLDDPHGRIASNLVTSAGAMPSAEPAFGVHALAASVRAAPLLAGAFEASASDAEVLEGLRAGTSPAHRAFVEALARFLDEHGHRAVCEADPRAPSWREDPAQVVAMIRNALVPGAPDPNALRVRQTSLRETTRAEALRALGWLRGGILARVEADCLRFLPLRERLKDAIVRRSDGQRRIVRELAQRFVARGWLAAEDDVHFLVADELAALARGTLASEDARARTARRRADFAICERLEVPKLQEGTPRIADPAPLPDGDVLEGLGVFPGRVEGRARVVLDPRTDARLEPGEILVAPVTDAGWTPLFVGAAALVVDVGGLLSHGSVVAREYGLTAVVGVGHATRRIRTGDRIVVDGDAGKVVLQREAEPPPPSLPPSVRTA